MDFDKPSSFLTPILCKDIKSGMFILLQGETCKIIQIQKTNKIALIGLSVFDSKKYVSFYSPNETLYTVRLETKNYPMVDVNIKNQTIDYLIEENNTLITKSVKDFVILNKARLFLKDNKDCYVQITKAMRGSNESNFELVNQITNVYCDSQM